MIVRWYIILAVLISCFAGSSAQFVGTVYDVETGLPVEGIEIFHTDLARSVFSQPDGSFSFGEEAKGLSQLLLFGIQYETLTDTVDFTSTLTKDYYLKPLAIELASIDVVARRKELFALKRMGDIEGTAIYAGKKTEVILLDQLQVDKAGNTARQIYSQISGLNIYESSAGGLQLHVGGRGLDPNRTANFATRQNGYDISADVLGYPESYYTPPPEALEEVRIIRGASSLQYGTQFGGLIDFRTRQILPFEKARVSLQSTLSSWDGQSLFAYVGAREGKVLLDTYVHTKNGDGYRNASNYDSYSQFISLRYPLDPRSELRAEVTVYDYVAQQAGGLTDAQLRDDSRQATRERNWFAVKWRLFHLAYHRQLAPTTQFSLALSRLRASRDAVGYRGNPLDLNANPITALDEQDALGNYISPRDIIRGDFANYSAEMRLLTQYKLKGSQHTLLTGAKVYTANNSSQQGPGSTGVDADFRLRISEFSDYANQSNFLFPNRNIALFAENIFTLSDHLSITPGIRLEYIKTETAGTYRQVVTDNAGNVIANREQRDDRVLARGFLLAGVGLHYRGDSGLEVIANISQNYRSVTFSDIRTVNPSFIVDPDLRDERGFTVDVGVRGTWQQRWSYEATLYSLYYGNRLGIILDDRANRVRTNVGSAVLMGLESLIVYRIGARATSASALRGKIFLNTALTYSQYLRTETAAVTGNFVEFVPSATIKTSISLRRDHWSMRWQYSYVAPQFTDAQNSAIAQEGDQRSGIIGEIPSYGVVDMSVRWEDAPVSLQLGLNNLLDATYFTQRATGYPGPGIIPSDGRNFYVTIGVDF